MTRSGPLVATACILLAPILRAQPAPTCEQWNTREFFRVASVEDVTACLDAGSDVSARAEEGYTPLHHAAQASENPEVVDALLAAGADPDTRDQHGDTPLSLAAFDVSSRTAVVGSLLTAGANPRTRNERGRTALHYAAAVWKAPEIAALLAAGAEPMARDADGQTPLHHAADPRWGRVTEPQRAIDALLDAGADPSAEDDDGITPWDLAKENDELRGSDAYWRMNDARFTDPPREVRSPTTTPPAAREVAAASDRQPQRSGQGCEIAGNATSASIKSLVLSWCGPSVDFRKRALARRAAGAWCVISGATLSTPQQIYARQLETSGPRHAGCAVSLVKCRQLFNIPLAVVKNPTSCGESIIDIHARERLRY